MKHPAVLLAGILLLLPATLVTYRILWLNYPLSLRIPGKAWQLSMQAEVQADKNGIQIEIGLPFSSPHQRIVSELISSGGLDFDLVRNRPNRIGIWSAVEVGGAFITYRATILESPPAPRCEGDSAAWELSSDRSSRRSGPGGTPRGQVAGSSSACPISCIVNGSRK